MNPSSISIFVTGPQGSGKTALIEALNKAIREKATVGLETTFRPTDQFVQSPKDECKNLEYWVLRDTTEAIPEGIYWDEEQGSFADIFGTPNPKFTMIWFSRRKEFPKSKEELHCKISRRLLGKETTDRLFPNSEETPSGIVPLGPNRTRDGREVRVIANDVKGKYPVVVVLPQDGREIVSKRWKDGTSPYGSGGDLVGHLPPEPPKPREIWICAPGTGLVIDHPPVSMEEPADADARGYKLFREVIE